MTEITANAEMNPIEMMAGVKTLTNTGRIIMLYSDIVSPVSAEIVSSLLAFQVNDPTEEITLMINSNGGEVDEMYAMIDIMDILSCPVRTIINGKAMSAGATLAICGTPGLRQMTANSRMMLHTVSGAAFGPVKDVKIDVNEINRLNEKMLHMIADRSKLTYEEVEKLLDRDKYLTPEEALEYGLIDSIIDSIK